MSLRDRILGIRLLVLDVDGVLTRGAIEYAASSPCVESKAFHVRDGSGLKLWHQAGHASAILTGRASPAVSHRAAETGVRHVLQGCKDKAQALEGLLREVGLGAESACFVGDDVIDVEAMNRCGLAVAVADACPEALLAAGYVTRARGGEGAAREAVELILRCQGRWPAYGR